MIVLRDYCQWHDCPHPSDLTYRGIGLCEAHWAQCWAVYQPDKTKYLLPRVTPAAAQELQQPAGRTFSKD